MAEPGTAVIGTTEKRLVADAKEYIAEIGKLHILGRIKGRFGVYA